MASEQSFVPTSVNVEIEGDITVPGAPEEDEGPSTLDEPVAETLVSCISVIYVLFKDAWPLHAAMILQLKGFIVCIRYFMILLIATFLFGFRNEI